MSELSAECERLAGEAHTPFHVLFYLMVVEGLFPEEVVRHQPVNSNSASASAFRQPLQVIDLLSSYRLGQQSCGSHHPAVAIAHPSSTKSTITAETTVMTACPNVSLNLEGIQKGHSRAHIKPGAMQ